jgi:hypothetical protein
VPALPLEAHPFLLYRSFQSAEGWTLEELTGALRGLSEVDRGAKSGGGSGFELMETWLLSRSAG